MSDAPPVWTRGLLLQLVVSAGGSLACGAASVWGVVWMPDALDPTEVRCGAEIPYSIAYRPVGCEPDLLRAVGEEEGPVAVSRLVAVHVPLQPTGDARPDAEVLVLRSTDPAVLAWFDGETDPIVDRQITERVERAAEIVARPSPFARDDRIDAGALRRELGAARMISVDAQADPAGWYASQILPVVATAFFLLGVLLTLRTARRRRRDHRARIARESAWEAAMAEGEAHRAAGRFAEAAGRFEEAHALGAKLDGSLEGARGTQARIAWGEAELGA
ncbi:MAG TPA: hypothetical protein RMH99_19370, partial [Sandaracinaceae bacterium LLY-WYZ-13_1]|nr:hypothetical protein [Sandaracinaceae bacterium LLY-WYZ-13_1]